MCGHPPAAPAGSAPPPTLYRLTNHIYSPFHHFLDHIIPIIPRRLSVGHPPPLKNYPVLENNFAVKCCSFSILSLTFLFLVLLLPLSFSSFLSSPPLPPGRAASSASEGGGPDSGFTSRQTSQVREPSLLTRSPFTTSHRPTTERWWRVL